MMKRLSLSNGLKILLIFTFIFSYAQFGVRQDAEAALRTIDVKDQSIADWSGITTVFSDSLGDGGGKGQTTDLMRVLMASDANHLFVRWDVILPSGSNTVGNQLFGLRLTTARPQSGTTAPTHEATVFVQVSSDVPLIHVESATDSKTVNVLSNHVNVQQVVTGNGVNKVSSIEAAIPFAALNGGSYTADKSYSFTKLVSSPITAASVVPLWAMTFSSQAFNSKIKDTVPDSGYLDWDFSDGTYTPVGTGPIPSIQGVSTTPVISNNDMATYQAIVTNVGDNADNKTLGVSQLAWTLPAGFTYQGGLEKGTVIRADGSRSELTFTGPSVGATGTLNWGNFSTSTLASHESLLIEFDAKPPSSSTGKFFSSVSATVNTSTSAIETGETAQVTIPAGTARPTGLLASQTTETTTHLSWIGVTEATGYNLYQDGILLNSRPLSSLSYDVSGLQPGHTYTFRVTAIVSGNETLASDPLMVATLPLSPVNLSALPLSGAVSLTWSSVSGASGYKVYMSTTSGAGFVEVDSSLVKTHPFYTVTGLTDGTTYYFKIKAVNASGVSGFSQEISAIPLSMKPLAPTDLQGVSKSTTSAELSWTAVPEVSGYLIYHGDVVVKSLSSTETSTTMENLSPGTTYTFTIRSINANVESDPSEPVTITTFPEAPADLAIDEFGTTTANLSWQGVPEATGYVIYVNGQLNKNVGPEAVSAEITGLEPGTPYTFAVRALKGEIESADSNVEQIITVPLPPSSLLVQDSTPTSITLQWQGSTGAVSYKIYVVGETTPLMVVTSGTTAQMNGLREDTDYSFEVTALNGNGFESARSDAVAARTLPALPGLSITLAEVVKIPSQGNEIEVTIENARGEFLSKKWARGELSVTDSVYFTHDIEGSSFHVEENGWYSVYVQDGEGQEVVEKIKITNIDREPPTITTTWVGDTAYPRVNVSVSALGTGSGIQDVKYAQGVQELTYFHSAGTTVENHQFFIDMNVPYTLYAKDDAGNEERIYLYPMGDVDFNQELNVTDWLEVVGFVLSRKIPTPSQSLVANLNFDQDDKINVIDLVKMANMIVGK
ncbi:fibronectin type III domain-containing protein [Ammoniphilus sp. CFH 90114]|uniref:fibronectin type III domain-containing protein n=1 Tax=Ammoniphilus sp. CFH 90114 TaxID=2493665 RepID=UPI00100E005D|nr:fibronectin type III domain-containing protein [Ammoniphilus sp. CFH 90114]RXT02861.1 hypothetical protein EIZ39_24020 [Ammoniphilus sp. CFH 90114]